MGLPTPEQAISIWNELVGQPIARFYRSLTSFFGEHAIQYLYLSTDDLDQEQKQELSQRIRKTVTILESLAQALKRADPLSHQHYDCTTYRETNF